MKVLIADKFPEAGRATVSRAGVEVVYDPDLNDATLAAAVRSTGAEILVVRGTKVTAATLGAGRLSLVVRAGAGYDTIDVSAASARGIYVSNCPGKNSVAVAELTFALMLALDRRIPANAADLQSGRWNKAEYGKARGLFGRTLGLVGLGRIGQEVLGRARAFGMPVVAWSPSLTPERAASLGVTPRGGESTRRRLELVKQSPTNRAISIRRSRASMRPESGSMRNRNGADSSKTGSMGFCRTTSIRSRRLSGGGGRMSSTRSKTAAS
jgi:D-3-phosphoglycerate dehydrogenase